jgi:hypothetical protein
MSFRTKSYVLPAALVLAGSLVWLGSAAATNVTPLDGERFAQATPATPPAPPATTPPQAGGAPGMQAGPMGPHPAFNPKEMCVEHVARRIGNRAYLKARLDLTAQQLPLWNSFEKAADEASAKDKARCAALPTEMKTAPTYPERMNMREEMMKARIASLEATKPSLQALYASLTPEQKAIFDKPMRGMRGMGGHHRHHGRG